MLSLCNNEQLRPISPKLGVCATDSRRAPCVPVDQLLTARFLSRNTAFTSFESLLSASGFSSERFLALDGQPSRFWDHFIRRTSCFADWKAMLRDAQGEWIMLRLGIVVDD